VLLIVQSPFTTSMEEKQRYSPRRVPSSNSLAINKWLMKVTLLKPISEYKGEKSSRQFHFEENYRIFEILVILVLVVSSSQIF
jgi:hypothetical protein